MNEVSIMDRELRSRLSIVMIVTDVDEGLARRLSSVTEQLEANDEIIIIGKDAADPAAVISSNAQTVWGETFREGLERALYKASGEFIFLAESCDVWHPGKRAACVAALEQGAIAAVHDAVLVDGDLNELQASLLGSRLFTGPLCGVFHKQPMGCCMALQRAVLSVALPIPRYISSPDCWLIAAARSLGRVTFIQRALTFYSSRHATAGRHRIFDMRHTAVTFRELIARCFLLRIRIRKLRSSQPQAPL